MTACEKTGNIVLTSCFGISGRKPHHFLVMLTALFQQYLNGSNERTGKTRTRTGFGGGHRPEHDVHGGDWSFHRDSVHHSRDGRSSVFARLGRGSHSCVT